MQLRGSLAPPAWLEHDKNCTVFWLLIFRLDFPRMTVIKKWRPPFYELVEAAAEIIWGVVVWSCDIWLRWVFPSISAAPPALVFVFL